MNCSSCSCVLKLFGQSFAIHAPWADVDVRNGREHAAPYHVDKFSLATKGQAGNSILFIATSRMYSSRNYLLRRN